VLHVLSMQAGQEVPRWFQQMLHLLHQRQQAALLARSSSSSSSLVRQLA
jgi:hypothetical protein